MSCVTTLSSVGAGRPVPVQGEDQGSISRSVLKPVWFDGWHCSLGARNMLPTLTCWAPQRPHPPPPSHTACLDAGRVHAHGHFPWLLASSQDRAFHLDSPVPEEGFPVMSRELHMRT